MNTEYGIEQGRSQGESRGRNLAFGDRKLLFLITFDFGDIKLRDCQNCGFSNWYDKIELYKKQLRRHFSNVIVIITEKRHQNNVTRFFHVGSFTPNQNFWLCQCTERPRPTANFSMFTLIGLLCFLLIATDLVQKMTMLCSKSCF